MSTRLGTLTNVRLESILRGCARTCGPSVVLCKDQLASICSPDAYRRNYVINMQSSTAGNGTHWTCVTYSHDGQSMFYFDSFGGEIPTDVAAWLKRSGKPTYYNNVQIQDFNSTNCGWYCLMFLIKIRTGSSFTDFLSSFTPSYARNERLLRQFFGQ